MLRNLPQWEEKSGLGKLPLQRRDPEMEAAEGEMEIIGAAPGGEGDEVIEELLEDLGPGPHRVES